VINARSVHPADVIERARNDRFEEILADALAEPEVSAGLRQEHAPSARKLKETAWTRRDEIFGQAKDAEDTYDLAEAESQAERRQRRIALAGALIIVLAPAGDRHRRAGPDRAHPASS
jgi:hypothetical protein